MAKKKLDDKFQESIKNYESEIKTLETFVEAVRKRLGMYIGYKGNRGYMNMVREVLQNCIDELVREMSPCDHINITFDEASCTIIIEDNGRGIPFSSLIRVFTSSHTSSNYEKKLYDYTSGTNGVGAKVTNALSSKFIVESYILGEARRVEFNDGVPSEKGIEVIPNKEGRQGTIILFVPSFDIMGNITTSANDILGLLQLLNPLTPLGSKFYYKANLSDGKTIDLCIENKDGLMTYLFNACKSPMIKPIYYTFDRGDMKAEVVFTYDANIVENPETMISFCNFCPTDSKESTHVKGFYSGIKKFFVNYMNKVFLNSITSTGKKKKKNISIVESDIRTGLRAVVNAAHLEPTFTGQAKDILSTEEMLQFVEELTIKGLENWAKENPQPLQKLCKYFKQVAEVRSSIDDKKVKLSNQYSSTTNGLPSKFCKPTKQNKEFYIVEGDSAGGSFKTNRVNETQGVFPIRGMILNCFEKKSDAACLENPEVAGIIAIIGGGYGKNFDIRKVQWEKVIACFTGDTRVRTLNASTDRMTFKELTEYSQSHPDETIWVYSYDINTGEYVPGIAKNIGIKEYATKLAKVTLDDGGVITCTLDHRFLTKDRGYVEAQDLICGESLVPLYTKPKPSGSAYSSYNDREMIYDAVHGGWNFTDHWVKHYTSFINYINNPSECIYHKDGNKLNNSPDNLIYIENSNIDKYNVSEEDHLKSMKECKPQEQVQSERLSRGKSQTAKVICQMIINNGGYLNNIDPNVYEDTKKLVSSEAPGFDNILDYFDSFEEVIQAGKYYNHKVASVEVINTTKAIPMYCLEVDGFNNFAVCDSSDNADSAGCVIVHNCSDADSAGAEIEALLLRLVLRLCPQLIMAGKYYKAIPPLYYIKKGKKKLYFADKINLVQYIQKEFSKKNVLTTVDDRKISAGEIQEILYNNIDYIYELEKIANRYRVQPDILEMYLNNRDLSPEKICKIIKKKYRFIDMVNINGHTVCDGIVNGKSNTLIMDDRILNECTNIINIMNKNLYNYYKVNGQLCTILDIMRLYESSSPDNLNRLKGLGEQDKEELAESVILPGDLGNRTLLQYTMSSAMKEIENIRRFESNKNLLLEGLVVSRLDIAD